MRILCVMALALALSAPAAAQQTGAGAPAAVGYTVFVRGQMAGHENVSIQRAGGGFTVTSEGRMSAPVNLTLRRAELRYRADWSPESFSLDSSLAEGDVTLRTTFRDGSATSEGTQLGTAVAKADSVSTQALVLPDLVWGAYAAVAQRLVAMAPESVLRVYIPLRGELDLRVRSTTSERVQVGTTTFEVRRHDLLMVSAGAELPVQVTATPDGALVRVSIPAQMLEVVRDDAASPTARTQIHANAGDEGVVIPGPGFNIGATITRPRTAAASGRWPAVALHAGSGVNDRDGTISGIATMGQLAGALADDGFLVIRYDRRGFGQSGGRAESAGLADVADDLRTVVKWLADRKDVDSKRIAVAGHSEGAWIALLAAARDKRIAAVITLAGPSAAGNELVLEQQQRAFELSDTPQTERSAKVTLQQQINTAVLTGKGWDGLPAEVRRDADTPWFQSLLAFEPAKVLDDVRQPLLIVQGSVDRQVPAAHAERLAALARQEGKARSVDVVIVPGVNHLLVPATTGEVSEYASLTSRDVSSEVATAMSAWLTRTFAATR